MACNEGESRLRAELAAELGYIPASLAPEEIERHRQLDAAAKYAPSQERIERKYAHLWEGVRRAKIEADGRSEVADLYA
jgi:hypothetical protein